MPAYLPLIKTASGTTRQQEYDQGHNVALFEPFSDVAAPLDTLPFIK